MTKKKTENKKDYSTLSIEELRKENDRLQRLGYEIGDGKLNKCPACKAKPNEKCKTAGGNEREYPHNDRRESPEVKEQMGEIGVERTKLCKLIDEKLKAKEESDRLERLDKQKTELSALVNKDIEQSLVVEYRNDDLIIVEANNIIVPPKYLKVNRESLEKLLNLGVKVQLREPLPEPPRRSYVGLPFSPFYRSDW